jgi:hypothetical protein
MLMPNDWLAATARVSAEAQMRQGANGPVEGMRDGLLKALVGDELDGNCAGNCAVASERESAALLVTRLALCTGLR